MTNTGPKPFFSDIYRSTKEGRNRKKNAFHAWFPTAEQPSTISGFPKFSSPLRFSFFFLSQVGMSFEPELEEPVRNTQNKKSSSNKKTRENEWRTALYNTSIPS